MSDICLPHTCTHTHQYGCKRTHIHVHTTHTHTHHTGQEGSWLKNMLPDTGTRTQRSPKPSATTSSGETRAIPGLGGDWTEDIVGGGVFYPCTCPCQGLEAANLALQSATGQLLLQH